jgi:hypothetical protein
VVVQDTGRKLVSFVAVLYLSNYFLSLMSTIGVIPGTPTHPFPHIDKPTRVPTDGACHDML